MTAVRLPIPQINRRPLLRWPNGARRFDLGNYNFLAAVAMEAAQDLLNGLGTERIEAHAHHLASRLAAGLCELGLPVCRGSQDMRRDHLVCVGAPGEGLNATGDARIQSRYKALVNEGVKLSIRKDMLRFSLHLYNSTDDVDRVLDIAGGWARTRN